jgi:uncharacterized lipoprotein YmbA
MMRTIRISWIILLLASGMLPAACLLGGGGVSTPTRFYKLESLRDLEPGRKGEASLPEVSVAVGPIGLAAYLDRPQIVTLSAENELRVNEFDRWGESLKSGITRVVADNLALLLDTTRVAAAASQAFPRAGYQVAIDISRFEGAPGGRTVLQARWRIISGENNLRKSRGAALEERSPGSDFASLVKAHSLLLARLSREIAEGVAALSRE